MCADVPNFGTISGIPSFHLDLDLYDDFTKNQSYFRVRCLKLDPGARFGGNLNTSLNTSLNSGSHCRK